MRITNTATDGRITIAGIMSALQVQGRVLNGLMLRESQSRFGRHKLGFFWMFFEPMVFVSLFLVFTLIMPSPSFSNIPDVYFIITGITPFLLFRQTMNSLGMAIASSRSLLAFPQVTTFDVILSVVILEFVTVLFVFAVLVIGASLFYGPPNIDNPLTILYGTFLFGVTGTGIGMVFASLVPLMPSFKNISAPFLGRPMLFTSGVFFTAEMLPDSVRDILLYNPLLHMSEIVRSGFFIEFESQYADWNYASIFAASVFLFGLLMHQALKDQAIKIA